MTFEPKIVGFLCNWCSYTGADLAGTSRIKYPPNVRVIRVMCSARIDPTFVLKALSRGRRRRADLRLPPGRLSLLEGNYKTMRRFPLLKRLLDATTASRTSGSGWSGSAPARAALRRHRGRHDRERLGELGPCRIKTALQTDAVER